MTALLFAGCSRRTTPDTTPTTWPASRPVVERLEDRRLLSNDTGWLGINGTEDNLRADLVGMMTDVGLRRVRMGLDTNQPVGNAADDARVNAYRDAGIVVHAVVNYRGGGINVPDFNQWVANYKARLVAYMTRYAGKINYYIVGNEPDGTDSFTGGLTPAQAVALTRAAYEASRQVDPSGAIKIESPPTMSPETNYLRDMMALGLTDYSDFVGVHVYGSQIVDGRYSKPAQFMEQTGATRKPVAASESGVSTDWAPAGIDPRTWQQNWLNLWYVQSKRYGLGNGILFESYTPNAHQNTFALLKDSAGNVIGQTYNELKYNLNVNGLFNGGFENGANDFKRQWVVMDPNIDDATWTDAGFDFRATPRTGGYALQVDTSPSAASPTPMARQVVGNLTPGQATTVTAWAFSSNGAPATLKAQGYDRSDGLADAIATTTGQGTWQKLEVTVTPTNPWLVIELSAPRGSNAGTFARFDDVSIAPAAAPAAGIANGGFETVALPNNSFRYDPAGSDWTFFGTAGIQRNGGGFGAAPAPQGAQTLFLQGNGGGRGAVAQRVSTAGGQFTLSFDAAGRAGQAQTQPVRVSVDGVVIGTYTPAGNAFQNRQTAPFNLSAGTHTIRFEATNNVGDNTTFIDNIALTSSQGLGNASFELPTLAGGTYAYNPTGATWTFTGNAGIESNGSAWEAANAPDGSQAAFLQGNPNQGTGAIGAISQTVNVASAGTYVVTFQAARRNGQVQPVRLNVDGASIGATITPTSNSFTTYTTASFSLSAGVHTIRLEATDNAYGDRTTFVDAVTLTAAASSNVAVANASFEAPPQGSGYAYRPTGAGWNFTGNSGVEGNNSAWSAAAAPDGTQAAFLQSNGPVGVISQVLNFVGGSYTLSFQAARRSGQVQPIRFSVDGVQIGALLTPASDSFALLTSTPFTVAAGSHTIQLSATNASGDLTSFVDAIAVTGSTSGTLANVATGGTATASNENTGAGEGAAQAFDGSSSSKWLALANTATLTYQFASNAAYAVAQYSITSANDAPGRDPRSWSLLASDDGVNWTALDSRANQSFADRFATNTYAVNNATAYKYYRLSVTANAGDPITQLAELQLFALV